MESELFGHEAGAFTGAKQKRRGLIQQADGGTLFLDELAEMHIDLQSKLLKVIEDQRVRPLGSDKDISVDVQIVAASNRDLTERVESGDFRSDLYHRLSVFELVLPSLKDRIDDLDELVPLIVDEFNAIAGKNVRDIPDEVWAALKSHSWPGNVRELRNVIERCVLFSDGPPFPARWLQLPGQSWQPKSESDADTLRLPLDGSVSLEEMEAHIIRVALERSNYNATAAARSLGTTRQKLRYRAQKHGVQSPTDDASENSD